MDPASDHPRCADRLTGRWVGVVLSLLIAGAGIFLAGRPEGGACDGSWRLARSVADAWPLRPCRRCPGSGRLQRSGGLMVALGIVDARALLHAGFPHWVGSSGWPFCCWRRRSAPRSLRPENDLRGTFKVPTGSMAPTVRCQETVCSFRPRLIGSPLHSRGDVVVFRTDALRLRGSPSGQFYLKRVAALAGETRPKSPQAVSGQLAAASTSPPVLHGSNFASFSACPS